MGSRGVVARTGAVTALMVLVLLSTVDLGFCLDGESILKGLRDGETETRRQALESPELAACYASNADEELCPPNPELLKEVNQELVRLLGDGDPAIRRVAARYLSASTDEQAIAALGHLLRDGDEDIRSSAVSAFVHIKTSDPHIITDLEKLLRDRNKGIRTNAAMALGVNGTPRSLRALRSRVSREAEPDVKAACAQSAAELERRLR
jgi:HEAT repeat protein